MDYVRKDLIDVNKLLKIMCLLLSLLLLTQAPLLALAEGETEEPAEVQFPEELIVGHPTVTKGDFFTEMFGNDTADIDVRALIHGYNLVNWDQNQGVYVMDPSVVTEYQIVLDELGNKTYRMMLADDLYYSDGTPITAWDYAFSILLMTVPYPINVIAPGCKVYDDGNGVYLGNADNKDASFTAPVFTADLLKKTILDPETGYNSHPSVVSGPYVIADGGKAWDPETGDGHFVINEYFKGAWMHNTLPGPDYSGPVHYIQIVDEEGNPKKDATGNEIWLVKPTIEKICFKVADNDTMIQQLADGELHLVNKVTYGPTILEGMQGETAKGAGIQNQRYPRIGLSFLTFTYDWPTVHDKEVRQAIAWCMDRDLLASEYCGAGFGTRVDGYFGIEQWEYLLVTGSLGYPVNLLKPEELEAIEAGDSEDLTKKYKNRYVKTAEDYETAVAAWKALANEWEGTLVKYTVDLSKANALLDSAGWTLNRNGEAYQAGVDDVRCKKMEDGTLVALDLKMMYPAGNHIAEIMQTSVRGEEDAQPSDVVPGAAAGSFIDNLAAVGIKLELVPEAMEDLLKSYYRQTERTTDMIYLATNFHVIVDPSITYSTDKTKNHQIWNNTYSDDEDLYYRAVNMRKTEPGDIFEYVSKWVSFQERYNEVLPTIPIYSNIYFDFYNQYLQNYYITGQVTWSQAILPAYFALENLENAAAPAEEAGDEGLETFDD